MSENPAPFPPAEATPISREERIPTLDILRGFALLGILIMNILVFGLPMQAQGNPSIAGGATGLNLWAWIVQEILFEGRMRGLFSIMFGAGVYLLIDRAEHKGLPAADIHYRRILWLMLFGIIHAYAIWWGDILFPYALMGLLLYPLRKLSVRALFSIAAFQFAFMTAGIYYEAGQTRDLRDRAMKVEQAAAKGEKLTQEQLDTQKEWKEKQKDVMPDKESLAKETKARLGSYVEVRTYEAKDVSRFHGLPIYSAYQWDVLGMMLIGIALIRMGVLSGEKTSAFYWKLAFAGYAIGFPISAFAVWRSIEVQFNSIELGFIFTTYELSRLAVTLGHVGTIILIARSPYWTWLTGPISAVGKMAFSNYIATSLICTTIFYGYGFARFGKMERYQLYYVVLGVWAFNLIWSPIWLSRFRFGPLEWLWRSLTYWKRQPMRIETPLMETGPEEKAREATAATTL
jgi:uncharacterized protein